MIVKILHQAWCGPEPIPEREKGWCALMKKMNPDFDVRLYGNELLETYGQDPYIKEMMSRGTAWAFVMDRLRCLLLRDHGGIWLDPDCQPLRPLSRLNELWSAPHVTFCHSIRPPDRQGVALSRGAVAFADNTFLASAPNSRVIQRVLELWKPSHPVINGGTIGKHIFKYHDLDVVCLRPNYFYSMTNEPDALVLHDPHNLGTWVPFIKQTLPIAA